MDNCSEFVSSLSDNMTESELWQSLIQEEQRETISKIPAFLYISLLIILGVPGNIIVLLVYRSRFPASTTKCFIMAMAAFDLCSCLIAMPFEIVDLRFDFQLDILVGCKIMRFLVALFAYGSVLVLIGVAVDRFKRVCRPYSRQMTVKRSKTGIVLIAVMATIFTLPNLIFYGRQTIEIRGLILVDCSIDDAYSESVLPKLYFVFQGLCWFLAIICLSIMYGFIIFGIKKANRRRHRFDSKCYSDSNIVNTVSTGKITHFKDLGQIHSTSKEVLPQPTNTTGSNARAAKTQSNKDQTQTEAGNIMRNNKDSGDASSSATDVPSSNRKNNTLARLFSRDVNPVSDRSDSGEGGESLKDSVILATIPDQEEETLDSDLKRGQPGSGMEDGVSMQNLLTDENFDDSMGDGGVDNTGFEDEPLKIHGTLHISASEGNILGDTSSLNKYHKILSENVQELNVITDGTDLSSFQNFSCIQRPQSCEHVPIHAESEQQIASLQADDSRIDSITKRSDAFFQRSKSSPVRKTPQWDADEKELGVLYIREQNHSCEGEETTGQSTDKMAAISNNNSPGVEAVVVKPDSNIESNTSSHTVLPSSDHLDIDHNKEVKIKNSTHNEKSSQQPHSNNVNESIRTSYTSQRQNSVCSNHDYNMTSSQSVYNRRKQSGTKELKTSKLAMMMFHVTLGFVLSYLPHLSIQIAKILAPGTIAGLMCDPTFFGFYHVALRSIFLNHTLNPLIYGYYNKRFRQYCTRLLIAPCKFFKKSTNASTDWTQSFSMEQA